MQFLHLPYDMRVLVSQLAECDRLEIPAGFDCELLLTPFPVAKALADCSAWEWDERGTDHIAQIAASLLSGECLPPLIVENGRLIDGRHRTHAAHSIGQSHFLSFDLVELLYNVKTQNQKKC